MTTRGKMSILSAIIGLLLSPINGQTGDGCFGRLQRCPPGQVRLDAIIDGAGAFLGGCTCGCPPQLADPQSANYCGAPRTVNFDAGTMQGDCSCSCPPEVNPSTCQGRQLWHEATCSCECPTWMPAQSAADCTAPQEFLPAMCECGCPQGSIFGPCTTVDANGVSQFIPGSMVTEDCVCDTSGVICLEPAHTPDANGVCGCPPPGSAAPGGGFYPNCELPQIQDPITCDCVTTTTTAPPLGAPQVANCESVGNCECHPGTTGTCTINCDVGNDACKDGEIHCNNEGADCIVNCLSGSACAGAAKIFGPKGAGSLIVNCMGGQACEGAVTMDASLSTKQLITDCQGSQSCKGSLSLLYGALGGKLTCDGAPDSCQGMTSSSFTLPAGIETTPMASFQCVGQFCPAAAPANFNNVPPGLQPPVNPVNPVTPTNPTNPVFPRPPPQPTNPSIIPLPNNPIPHTPIIVPGPSTPNAPNPVNPSPPQTPINPVPSTPTPPPILVLPPGVTPPLIPGMPPIPFIHSPPGGTPQTPANPSPPQPPANPSPPQPPANPSPPVLIPPNNPQPPVDPTILIPPNNPQPPINNNPGIPIPVQPIPGIGLNPQPAPGTGGSQGGTLIINTNQQPIPIVRPDEEVICEGTGGECACSGSRSCTIKCEVGDACKEKTLQCPRNHDCTIVCSGDAACIKAIVNGPHGKDLTVNCAGISACGDATFNAQETVNVAYTCSAKDSCKGSTKINCGSGNCEVSCLGEAACDSASILPNNAASFACSGAPHCPAQYTAPPVPIPTTPPTPPCYGYSCNCGGALQCFSNPDPLEGCHCVCPDSILLKSRLSDPALICGIENGAQEFNPATCGCDCPASTIRNCPQPKIFNQNTCQCECPGGNECPGAAVMNENTCQCECPLPRISPSDCYALGRVLRNCECACREECAGPGQIQDLRTCECACPAGTPLPSECPSGVVDQYECKCAPEITNPNTPQTPGTPANPVTPGIPQQPEVPQQSPFCCHPKIDGMTMWNGRCFDRDSEAACNAESNRRCVWKGPMVNGMQNPNVDCLDNPPRWPRGTGPICLMRSVSCQRGDQCCSEVCLVDGRCL